MIPNVDESLLFNEFGSSKNEYIVPSPQALWIKLQDMKSQACKPIPRAGKKKKSNQQNYQFTDTMVAYSESLWSNSHTTQQSVTQSQQVAVPPRQDSRKPNPDLVGKDIDQEELDCDINLAQLHEIN